MRAQKACAQEETLRFTQPIGRTVCVLICLVALAAMTISAEDGRDFNSIYEISNTNVGPDTVALTLTLRLFNHYGADVAGATVVLEDSSVSGGSFGSFSGVAVRYQEDVRLSADFVVSRAEYDAWQQSGGQPKMHIDFNDATGNSVTRAIEMARLPMGEGGQQ